MKKEIFFVRTNVELIPRRSDDDLWSLHVTTCLGDSFNKDMKLEELPTDPNRVEIIVPSCWSDEDMDRAYEKWEEGGGDVLENLMNHYKDWDDLDAFLAMALLGVEKDWECIYSSREYIVSSTPTGWYRYMEDHPGEVANEIRKIFNWEPSDV